MDKRAGSAADRARAARSVLVRSTEALQVKVAHYADEARVCLEGELDVADLADVREILFALLERSVRVVVDLWGLDFIDVPAVHLLRELAAVAPAQGVRVDLDGASGEVAFLLGLMDAGRPLACNA